MGKFIKKRCRPMELSPQYIVKNNLAGEYRFMKVISYMADRLMEPSTWMGLTVFITALGCHLNDVEVHEIILIGTGMAGFMAMIFPDK